MAFAGWMANGIPGAVRAYNGKFYTWMWSGGTGLISVDNERN
jgi:hypothetical protein